MPNKNLVVAELRRVLVVKLRHHGDVLLTTPLFSVLKRMAPHCEVDALVYDETAPMLSGNPDIDQIHTIGRGWKQLTLFRRLWSEWELFLSLRSRRYDLLIHLTENWRGAWLARSLRPKFSVAGFSPLRPPDKFWKNSFTHLAPRPPNANRHTVECHLDALRILGIQPSLDDRQLRFFPDDISRNQVAMLIADECATTDQIIHIHPTSRWMFKAWSVDRYAELISVLRERGLPVVVTASPDSCEIEFVARIINRCRMRPIDLSGRLSIKELGALISIARISISIDSMPMHIAAAAGTPVVALFGPSNENEWGPWQVPHKVVVSKHPCRPCRLDGCGGGKVSECLTSLNTSDVLDAVDSLLKETER